MSRPLPGASPGRPYRILLTLCKHSGHGSTQSVHYLAEGLRARGHDVRVACPPESVLAERLRASGVPVAPLEFGAGWDPRTARRLAALVREQGIELVDAQQSDDRKAAVLARWLYGSRARLVVTRRQESLTFPLGNLIYALAADRIIAISTGVARSLGRWGVPTGKVAVVHTALDPRRLAGEVAPEALVGLRRELGLAPELPTVGVVARRKDQETLLRALARAGRPVNLLFVGIGADRALRRLEGGLPAGSRVAYVSFREPVLPYYRLLDVKVLATRAEGLSQALLEAMWLGIPVVSAAVGGTPEVVRDDVNGLLFPPGDDAALAERLERLLGSEDLRWRLGEAGRVTVREEFDTGTLVRRTEAVYRDLLEGESALLRAPRPDPALDLALQQRALARIRPLLGDLPLELHGWSIDPHAAEVLMTLVARERPGLVLECGSGSSTVVLAAALRQLGGGRVVALEHEERFAERTRALLAERGLADWGEVVNAPLEPRRVGRRVFPWYGGGFEDRLEGSIDILLVDGPPARTARRARYPALPLLRSHLSRDCLIVMDDAYRKDERWIARRWASELPGARELVPGGRGLWLIRSGDRGGSEELARGQPV